MIRSASETWELKESMKRKFLINEGKILRRMFEPTKDRCGKCIENLKEEEWNNLIRHMTIINSNKAQGLSWFGHAHRITSNKMVKNYTSGNQYLQDWQED